MFFFVMLVFSLCFVCIVRFLSMSHNMWVNISLAYPMLSTMWIKIAVDYYDISMLEVFLMVVLAIIALVYAYRVKKVNQ